MVQHCLKTSRKNIEIFFFLLEQTEFFVPKS